MKQILCTLLLLGLIAGCSQVTSDPTNVQVTRTWTAPGDDGFVGQASTYDARYSTSVDSLRDHWSECPTWPAPVVPLPSGQRETVTFTLSVTTGIPYYFAIKTADEVPNWALISSIWQETRADVTPPSPIDDLE